MITKVSSTKNGQMVYHFSNGVILSMVWSAGSYTEDHFLTGISEEYYKFLTEGEVYKAEHLNWKSRTVEVYSMGIEHGIDKYFEEHYGGNPAGYVPVNDIPKILKLADKEFIMEEYTYCETCKETVDLDHFDDSGKCLNEITIETFKEIGDLLEEFLDELEELDHTLKDALNYELGKDI